MTRRNETESEARCDYDTAIKRENDREFHWRETEQGAFQSEMLSLDDAAEDFANRESAWASDGGAGAARIRDFDCGERRETTSVHKTDYMRAYMRVKRRNPKLLDVFKLVVKNGTNRRESIWELMKKMQAKPKKRFTKRHRGKRQKKPTGAISKSS